MGVLHPRAIQDIDKAIRATEQAQTKPTSSSAWQASLQQAITFMEHARDRTVE